MRIPNRLRGYLRVLTLTSLACALAIMASGCLVNRVMEVRQQFCDFDSNFTVDFDESATVRFTDPVILDKDILWLAGTQPTRRTIVEDRVTMAYVIEEDVPAPNPANEIGIELDFVLDDGDYKLEQIRADPKLNNILNSEDMNKESILSSALEICQTGLSFATRNVEFDISDHDLEQLPSRPEALEIMGPPHFVEDDGQGWTWQYRLKGNPEFEKRARFTVWFDDVSQKPLRMESRYARYHTKADFIAKKVSMNVKL